MYKGSSQTCYKMELRNRILKAAMTEFLHKGVKSVKMDDIANTLAISKRTLYEIYSNKEELLLEANKWELQHGGLSGRTAQQFIDYLCGKNKNK